MSRLLHLLPQKKLMKSKSTILLAVAMILSVSLAATPAEKAGSGLYFSTPKEGVTDFNNLYHGSFIDLTGIKRANGSGLLAANVAGYNFRLFSSNAAADYGIGVEPFTAQTALVYGYSQSGTGFTTALEVSSNDGKLFDLKSLDITVDNDGETSPVNVQLSGYLNGQPVSGAVLTLALAPASYGGALTSFNVSSNPAFIGIDMLRITGSALYAIGVDNIDAEHFRTAPLPLTFTHFTGTVHKDKVVLRWDTENEMNTRNFEIERSIDGTDFATLVSAVEAANTPGPHAYSFTDEGISSLSSQVVYYRIRQQDMDGRATLSPVIKLRGWGSAEVFSIFPNPAGNECTLNYNLGQPQEINIQFRDNSGKAVKHLNFHLHGAAQMPLDLKGLSKGVYYLEITGSTVHKTLRLIKR